MPITNEEMNNVVKAAVDGYKGCVEKYSVAQSNDLVREALIEANGGSTKLDYRKMRDGECKGVFTLLEQILKRTTIEGLQQNDFFTSLVEYVDVAAGDKPTFILPDTTLFTVDESADGTQAIRRQRLGGTSEITIPTSVKSIRVYEELSRVLAGRVDFNDLIAKVSESYQKRILEDIYKVWAGITANQIGATYYQMRGSYDEATLLDLIAHVEAAGNGGQAMILGTKKALRNLAPSGIYRMSDKAAINPDVLGAWLCLCKVQGAGRKISTNFEPDSAEALVSELKRIMLKMPRRMSLSVSIMVIACAFILVPFSTDEEISLAVIFCVISDSCTIAKMRSPVANKTCETHMMSSLISLMDAR